jgi:hypothetical protein
MRRFTLAVAGYLLACLIGIGVIVLRGDGPHPRVVAVYPPVGDRYFPGGPAQITFSQPMDQASVERALQVSPPSQGQGVWFGNTLNVQPLGDWRANVTYHLVLNGTVTDEEGRALHTPLSFWFRVHHVRHVVFCGVRSVRNVCELAGRTKRPLTASPTPILSYALSPDASMLAYTRRDRSGLAHLFLLQVDGKSTQQLTGGTAYADSQPSWTAGDNSDVSYYRQPVARRQGHPRLGKPQLWNVQTDGSGNARL